MKRVSQFAAILVAVGSTQAASAASPWNGYWILSPNLNPQFIKDQAADGYRFYLDERGALKWEIPSLQEVVNARLGGQPAEIRRPGINGQTLAVKAEGDRVLLYRGARDGKNVFEGRMTLVNHDTEWVDISQPFGHPEEAGVVVYTKAPDPSDPAVSGLRAAPRR